MSLSHCHRHWWMTVAKHVRWPSSWSLTSSGDSQIGWVFKNENPIFSLTKKNENPVSHVTKSALGKMKIQFGHENENPRGTQMCGQEVFLHLTHLHILTHSCCVCARASDSARYYKNAALSAHLLATQRKCPATTATTTFLKPQRKCRGRQTANTQI